jgi:LysM repeat protein
VQSSLILAANPRIKPRALRIGQRLVIPVSPTARARSRAPAARASARAPTPTVAVAPAPGGSRQHTVRWGESLWSISQRYGVTVANLRRWNGLEGDTLKPGQRLRVDPVAGGAGASATEESQ